MYSDSMLRYSSSIVADQISSPVIQSAMTVHDYMAFMVIFIPGISSSLFDSCLCLDSQSTAVVWVCTASCAVLVDKQ